MRGSQTKPVVTNASAATTRRVRDMANLLRGHEIVAVARRFYSEMPESALETEKASGLRGSDDERRDLALGWRQMEPELRAKPFKEFVGADVAAQQLDVV